MADGNMIIKIPHFKKGISHNKAVRAAVRAFEGKRWNIFNRSAYDLQVKEGYYYPYWIGEVYTKKARFLFKPKEINYYVVCDARHNGYLVLRGLPELHEIACDDKYILPAVVDLNSMNEVIEDAQKDSIDRKFIFGPPDKEIRNIYLTHIPVLMVKVRKKETGEFNKYFINALSGAVSDQN